ncbi:AraC family transcriptional regulator [Paenibacillus chondroitinus]|uniref:AraC family transcriptional regulator n=1 Tax=Paenibacillus chondroitinus TaxID=59842 RepID=A0ABU6DDJ6_9BACL|nr:MULTISPECIES: AraC family transcriptional regulator [Paenibacillus]MCY9662384.1 AraC family transcriptional regulator [Paenibacillus anseongense]MEB4795835.1 AraC family transcriptional regulator [Paenibacillus chondroitinus]
MAGDMQLEDQLHLWYQAAVKIMDVRHVKMTSGESLSAYRLPSNAFIFALQGGASIALDDRDYAVQKFHLLHGGKGSYLDIKLTEDIFEYYLVLYKASIPLPTMRDKLKYIDKSNSFYMQYSFLPRLPMLLYQILEQLEREWNSASQLAKLHAKSLLYSFIYELMQQLQDQNVTMVPGEPVAQAIRFMHEHYAESITLERLAEVLDCSPRQVTRMFKNQTSASPIDYLIRYRMEKAKKLLLDTDATLQQIAAGVGYQDVYFFSRTFKKHTGIAPVHFKENYQTSLHSLYNPFRMSISSIALRKRGGHTYYEDNNHSQYRDEGVLPMYRSSKPSIALVLLLSLTLFVTACASSSSPAGDKGKAQASTGSSNEQAASERVLKDALGHEVKVPANPQRVIASYLEDHLVALGVKPVAQWSINKGTTTVQNYLQKDLNGIPTIPFDLPFEAVMSFKPDLIIMDSAETVAGDKYDQYSKIAPTYTVGGEKNNDWRQELLTIGEVLNKSKEAKQALETYDNKAKDAKEKLQKAIGTQKAAALWVTAKAVYVVSEKLSSGDVLYKDLGLNVPSVVQEASKTGTANWLSLSMEKLATLDADYLFIVNSKGVSKEEILKDPVWAGIPAVKKGQVYDFDNNSSWLYSGTIANSQMIDDVLKSVVK